MIEKKGPRIQDIYNQTNPGQDYKIIPFVAEDAIRGKFGKVNNTIHELSNTTQSVPDMVSDFCFIKGRIFMNGEMIPKIDPCELCRCFYGQELCQIQRCPTPPPNCVAEKLPAFCCPRFTCAGNGIIGSPPVQKITMHSKQSPLIIQPIIDREPVEKSKITNQKPEEAKFGIRVRLRPTQMSKPIQTKSTIESTRTTGYSLSTTTTKKAEPTRLQEIQTTPIQTTTTSQIPKIVRNPTTKTFQYSKLTTTKQPETSQTTKESSTSGFFDPWGLLKVSGCNIYGKFFNINDQVEFLSGPCSHCICTVNGVECNDIC